MSAIQELLDAGLVRRCDLCGAYVLRSEGPLCDVCKEKNEEDAYNSAFGDRTYGSSSNE